MSFRAAGAHLSAGKGRTLRLAMKTATRDDLLVAIHRGVPVGIRVTVRAAADATGPATLVRGTRLAPPRTR